MNTKSLLLIFTLIASIMVFSGCTYTGKYLDVIPIDQPESYKNLVFKNITNTDLTPYPTLQNALEKLFTPNNNLTYVSLKISSDESDSMLNNDIIGYISYYNKYFSVEISTN